MWWISLVAFQTRNKPAGDQDQVAPGKAVAEGREHRRSQLYDDGDGGEQDQPHDQRRRMPSRRARARCASGNLLVRIEMKIRLSMPSTISSTTSVSSATHAVGSMDKGKMRRQELDHLHYVVPRWRINYFSAWSQKSKSIIGRTLRKSNCCKILRAQEDLRSPAGRYAACRDQCHDQKDGTVSSSRGPRRNGAIRSARPVRSEISTPTPAQSSPVRSPPRSALSAPSTGIG